MNEEQFLRIQFFESKFNVLSFKKVDLLSIINYPMEKSLNEEGSSKNQLKNKNYLFQIKISSEAIHSFTSDLSSVQFQSDFLSYIRTIIIIGQMFFSCLGKSEILGFLNHVFDAITLSPRIFRHLSPSRLVILITIYIFFVFYFLFSLNIYRLYNSFERPSSFMLKAWIIISRIIFPIISIILG